MEPVRTSEKNSTAEGSESAAWPLIYLNLGTVSGSTALATEGPQRAPTDGPGLGRGQGQAPGGPGQTWGVRGPVGIVPRSPLHLPLALSRLAASPRMKLPRPWKDRLYPAPLSSQPQGG